MKFEELFVKLEDNGKGGVAAILIKRIHDMKNPICIADNYEFVYGFIYGLLGAGFITCNEHKDLKEALRKMRFYKE